MSIGYEDRLTETAGAVSLPEDGEVSIALPSIEIVPRLSIDETLNIKGDGSNNGKELDFIVT